MKNKTIATLLAVFGGTLGLHKFYLWKWIQGIIYIVLCSTWIPTVLWILEGVVYALNTKQNFDIKYNAEYIRNREIIKANQ